MKLVIERKTWLRGGQFGSQLLVRANAPKRSAGKMCCLGFFALECGYTPQDIEDRSSPWSLFTQETERMPLRQPAKKIPAFTDYLIRKIESAVPDDSSGLDNSDLARQLMRANDDIELTDAQRERELTALFAQMNVEVEFVDEVGA